MRAIYRMVPFSVTLSDLEGHFSAVVTLCAQLTCDVSDSCVSGVGLHKFYIKLSLCGPSCGGGEPRYVLRTPVCPPVCLSSASPNSRTKRSTGTYCRISKTGHLRLI